METFLTRSSQGELVVNKIKSKSNFFKKLYTFIISKFDRISLINRF